MNRKMVKIFSLGVIFVFVAGLSLYAQEGEDYENYKETGSYGGGYESDQPSADDSFPSEPEPAEVPEASPDEQTPLVTPELNSEPTDINSEPMDLNSEPMNTAPAETYGGAATTPTFSTSSSAGEGSFQNAIIEGVQLTAEPGTQPDEKIVSGYFIFRDKPSSYFYEVKLREKKLIFEFNDTRVGTSPVPTASEPPIKGFIIEQGKIDVNKAVRGLKPEWHDFIRIVFDLEAVPDIHVNDEYSIISFSFKWSSDPEKQIKYIVRDQTPKIILWSTAGVGGIALGTVAYLFLRPPEVEKPLGPLPYDDLPQHKVP